MAEGKLAKAVWRIKDLVAHSADFFVSNFTKDGRFKEGGEARQDTIDTPLRSEIFTRDELIQHAKLLASEHRSASIEKSSKDLYRRFEQNERLLRDAYFDLANAAKEKKPLTPGAEWLLDNYHVVEEHARDVKKHLPRSYYRILPKLNSGPMHGYPRVAHVAVEIIAHSDAVIDGELLSSFIDSYQSQVVLTMGELWAIPIMLRIALIENLRRLALANLFASRERDRAELVSKELLETVGLNSTDLLLRLAGDLKNQPEIHSNGLVHLIRRLRGAGARANLSLQWLEERLKEKGIDPEEMVRIEQQSQAANQISIGNTITSLKAISALNWQKWFESMSKVDAALLQDPASIYHLCDFTTRDQYRHVIEKYARRTGRSEVEVAEQVVALAESFDAPDGAERCMHIGYYLIDEGKYEFEARLNYNLTSAEKVQRFFENHTFSLYSAGIIVLSLALVFDAGYYTWQMGGSRGLIALVVILFWSPASHLASDLIQWLVTHATHPVPLPKLEFEYGVPERFRTIVTVHTLFHDKESIEAVVKAMEVRFLANNEPHLYFAILADVPDSLVEHSPRDKELINYNQRLVDELNQRHFGAGDEHFFVLYRRRLWSKEQNCFMGWERKRGKIEEFNRLLNGETETTFLLNDTIKKLLPTFRYVITLDMDSKLPRGSARKLIATIAHPLNSPVIDPVRNVVTKGYGVIQPRVGVSLVSSVKSRFARVFSGNAGLDPYTQTVSDVYQDLFSEGSYVGKAIYDPKAFYKVLDRRIPDNALLSHDLFEGLFARVALASDIELLDEFPAKYSSYTKRQHRWVRGDWQLLPFIWGKISDGKGGKHRTPISLLGRWKLIDNLRRSLLPVFALMCLCLGWLFLPGSPAVWTSYILIVIAFPVYVNLANALIVPPLGTSLGIYARGVATDIISHSVQAIMTLSFLPFTAWQMLHSIGVTLYRLGISRQNLLEWESAHRSEKLAQGDILSAVRLMWPGMVMSIVMLLGVVYIHPHALTVALPILILWIASPAFASFMSQPLDLGPKQLREQDKDKLTQIAWDTWKYFDSLMVEELNWLIPDNIQLVPSRVIAERTSPTNISLSILSILSAHDLCFITPASAVQRIAKVYASLNKLERFHGHFLNWYQIRTLQALYPRYVSTVDSGNMVGHLIAARKALDEIHTAPIIPVDIWKHIKRELASGTSALEKSGEGQAALTRELVALNQALVLPKNVTQNIANARIVQEFLEKVANTPDSASSRPGEALDKLRSSLEGVVESLPLISWYDTLKHLVDKVEKFPDHEHESIPAIKRWLVGALKITSDRLSSFSLIPKVSNRVSEVVSKLRADGFPTHLLTLIQSEIDSLQSNLKNAAELSQKVVAQTHDLIAQTDKIVQEIDFRFLFDEVKSLFVIGYRVDDSKRDHGYYDLLASEARLASMVAIAKGEVNQKHWFCLGRPITDSPGGKVLLSWSATMFEYLMPLLVTKNFPETLLSETYSGVVKSQQVYGKKRGVPWGVSESAYSGVDFEKTYQYRAFGVPGLGLKRGLSDDLVVSPYSTLLAISIDPVGCMSNIARLEKAGTRGEMGFFEAVDYTPERLSSEEKSHVVQSHLGHHQGMSLIAINNYLNNDIFPERFHDSPMIKASELLLQERFPRMLPPIVPHQAELSFLDREHEEQRASRGEKLSTPHTAWPRTRLLSNGHYSVMLDNAGSGFSVFDRDKSITRWREDAFKNEYGQYIYVRDLESKKVWSATYQPTRVEPEYYDVLFNPDKVEYRRRDFGIALHTEITVSPEDNVEVRRVTATNTSNRKRNIEFTSYGEVVLGSTKGDAAHPAFAKMFIESEFIDDFDALVFSRRPRSAHEETLHLMHSVTMKICWQKVQYETARMKFIGRGNTVAVPQAFENTNTLSGSTGATLDPVFSLRARLELEPGESESVTFITGVARTKLEAIHLAERYHELYSISRAFEMAWSQSNVELRHEQFTIAQTHAFQRLGNALLFNISKVRGDAEAIAHNRMTQSGFWRFGVSGDLPILLVRVNDPAQGKIVNEALLAHQYLRLRGLVFDLIILNEYPGGYLQDFQEELESLLRFGYASPMVEKNGGIFLRKASGLSESEITLLEAAARVVIHGERESLAAQLDFGEETELARSKKRSAAPRDDGYSQFEPPYPECEFFNGVGGFVNHGKTYYLPVKGNALPPVPWSNVVANPSFGFMVTESGGGYTWSENSRENRLTPWTNDPVSDSAGEVVYIRDIRSGHFWSATPRPASKRESFAVRHSFGSSEFDTQIQGIFSRLVISGSPTEKVKWYQLKLVNGDFVPRTLEVFLYLDLVLGVLREESYRYVVTDFDPQSQTLFAVNHYNNEFAGRYVYAGSSAELASWTASRREFIGRNRDLTSPVVFDTTASATLATFVGSPRSSIKLSKQVGSGFDPCAALGVRIELEPGEEKIIHFYLGEAQSLNEMRAQAGRFKSSVARDRELERVHENWESLVNSAQVTTPSRPFDILMNGWLLYQILSCRILGRTALYQSGGALGFRDQLQDSMALVYSRPEAVKAQILLHASRQFVEGDVQHWWHPPTGRGVRTRISDDYLWLPWIVLEYIRITGDSAILETEVGFIEGPPLEDGQMETYNVPSISSHKATLYEHCVIAIDRSLKFGSHGLPFIGGGDWNDGMNEIGRQGKGESVWLGWFLCDLLKKFTPVVQQRNDNYRAGEYQKAQQELLKALEANGWDGQWYRRAYFDDGTPVGSKQNDECKIDSLSQSWSVMCGGGDPQRAATAMDSALRELVNRDARIISLLTPPFDTGKLEPGYIKGYLPGIRENGGQYTHAATWVVLALTLMGRGNEAFELMTMLNPITHTLDATGIAEYQGEPYVMAGDVYSQKPFVGRAGWTWYTGSASWLYRVGLEYILGLKLEGNVMRFDPCIPSAWKEYKLSYKHLGAQYEVHVVNPEGVQKGVKLVEVDGLECPDGKINLAPSTDSVPRTFMVKVVMG